MRRDQSKHGAQSREALWRSRLEQEANIRRIEHRRPYEQRGFRPLLRGLLRAAGLWERGLRNTLCASVTEQTFHFDRLPSAFDGFRLLHVSDFHFNGRADFLDAVCSLVRPLETDLCVLTGDYRLHNKAERAWVYQGLDALLPAIATRHGVIAILGNNDTSEFAEALVQRGVRVLVNEATELRHGGQAIWLAGVDDARDFRCASVTEAVRGVPPEAFTILLAHSPEVVHEAAEHDVDLYLCGHTHGGQIRLPILGAPYMNTRGARRFCRGSWRCGKLQGYTTVGLGTSSVPVRFNCPPEAVILELRQAPPRGLRHELRFLSPGAGEKRTEPAKRAGA